MKNMIVYDILLLKDDSYLVGTLFDENLTVMLIDLFSKIYDLDFVCRGRLITDPPSTSHTIQEDNGPI